MKTFDPMGNLPEKYSAENALLELTLSGRAVLLTYCSADDMTLEDDGEVLHGDRRIKATAVVWSDDVEGWMYEGDPETVGSTAEAATMDLCRAVL